MDCLTASSSDNDALTNSTLDYPAIPGLATFDTISSQPADVVTNAGSTVVFTATPTSSSPATYQWRYRTNLADYVSVPIPFATSTVLTLTNVSKANEGFYFLVVTNSVGSSESYAAQLTMAQSLAFTETGFEAPTYTTGPIGGQDYWLTDANANSARVLTDLQIADELQAAGLTPGQTVHGGSQALLITGAAVSSATIRAVPGFENETNVTLDVWVRPLAAGNTGSPTGNIFMTVENSGNTRAAAFRFGPANSIDYGSTDTDGVWTATGELWDENTWYHITLRINYSERSYDFLINDVQINSSPIPFYTSTSDSFDHIRIFRGANQAGMIMDDLSIAVSGSGAPTLGIRKQGSDLVVFWPASASGYTLQGTEVFPAVSWTTISYTTEGDENQAIVHPTQGSQFFRLMK